MPAHLEDVLREHDGEPAHVSDGPEVRLRALGGEAAEHEERVQHDEERGAVGERARAGERGHVLGGRGVRGEQSGQKGWPFSEHLRCRAKTRPVKAGTR